MSKTDIWRYHHESELGIVTEVTYSTEEVPSIKVRLYGRLHMLARSPKIER